MLTAARAHGCGVRLNVMCGTFGVGICLMLGRTGSWFRTASSGGEAPVEKVVGISMKSMMTAETLIGCVLTSEKTHFV